MVDDYSVYEELMYKWKRETSSVDILKFFRQYSKGKKIGRDYPEDYWLIYLSVLSERNRIISFKKLLKQYIGIYGTSKLSNYLHISRRLSKEICSTADQSRYVYKEILKTPIEKEIQKLMKGKTVAIVGNSDFEIGKGKGKEIDDHDVIIRFNYYQLSEFSKDYGSRTDIWVRNMEDCLDERPFEKYDLIVYSADLLHFPIRDKVFSSIVEALRNGCKVTSFESKSYLFLKDKGLMWPTSGASIIATIYLAFGGLSNIDFYGFSFLEDNPPFCHYYENEETNRELRKTVQKCHDIAKESSVLKEMGCR